MGLSPLPTTVIPDQEKTQPSVFPYPQMNQGMSLNNSPARAALSPLSHVQGEPVQNEIEHSTSEGRMRELENMLSEAQSRAAIIEQEAYDKAYAAGEKSGLSLGEKRAEQIIEAMQGVLSQAEFELKRFQEQSVTAVIDISQSVIEHVIGEQDSHMQQALEKLVHKALEQVASGYNEALLLLVNPKDLSMFSRMTEFPADTKITGNQEVEQGTCRLVSAGQDILVDRKQSIEKAISHLREHLLDHD